MVQLNYQLSISVFEHMTLEIESSKFDELKAFLEKKEYSFEERPHQIFLARKNGIAVNLYESGKIVISGRDDNKKSEITEYLLSIGAEDVLKLEKEYPPIEISGTRIGTDEAGKGDYFGPLVVAGTLVTEFQANKLTEIGVRDSKTLSDTTIQNLAVSIKIILVPEQYEVISITPIKYNILYKKIRNVNGILGWGHARAIENLLKFKEPCEQAIADQFGDQSYIQKALMNRGQQISLIQVPKAEREISVAAASILARSDYIDKMREMSEAYGMDFPKGASNVIEFAEDFVDKFGIVALQNVAKTHFATTKEIGISEIDASVESEMDFESVSPIYQDQDMKNIQLECFNLISSFEEELRKYLKRELELYYGENWWKKSVEENIRKKCEKLQRSELSKGNVVDVMECLEFEHYRLIITDRNNWPNVFENHFKSKERFLAQLQILKDIRHPVAHTRGRFTHENKLGVISSIGYFRKIFSQKKVDDFRDGKDG